MEAYVEVILPLALPQHYTYAVPEEWRPLLRPGMRVVVPLGKRKLYTGIVRRGLAAGPPGVEPKDILGLEDEAPIVSERQMRFWEWLAQYYLCTTGEVMQAAMPAALKLESESRVRRNAKKAVLDEELSDLEYLVVEALDSQESLSVKEVAAIVDLRNPMPLVLALMSKHYIYLDEQLKGGINPIRKRWVRLAPALQESDLAAQFALLQKAPKQSEVLLAFLQEQQKGAERVLAGRLLKRVNTGDATLKALAEKNILEIFWDEEEKPRPGAAALSGPLPQLSAAQEQAFKGIQSGWSQLDTVLLHGLTGSGKTEIYVRLIAERLARGEQVLFLVPEIALTTQLIQRLQRFFGDYLAVYHSRFNDRERSDTWLDLARNQEQPRLILGARSAIFLPFGALSLVIVDEEHESSYKQFEPAPRYHARDAALVLARLYQAKVLLGSATPSFESYYNARRYKYALVELMERYGAIAMPEVRAISLTEARKRKELHGHFSQGLIEAMEQKLQAGQQIILFQNRRGFTTFMHCETCGHVLECKHCDISLTYHRAQHQLRCHYCGFSTPPPSLCPACKSHQLRSHGFGTEKLEDDLRLMFPDRKIQRMDLDTTRRKSAYSQIIQEFEEGHTDILVGTQMVTKGLDFENVGLVGIMSADSMLHFPDFRSYERAFQTMVQVSGRAGRKGLRGLVLIQVSDPEHQVIRWVEQSDYQALYQNEMQERRQYFYPPFYRLIRLRLKHRKQGHLEERARLLGQALRGVFGSRVLGPEFPITARLRGLYQMELMLKIEDAAHLGKVKSALRQCVETFEQAHPQQRIQIIYEVDPY